MTGTDAMRKVDRLCRQGWTREEIASAVSVTVHALDKWRQGHAPRMFTAKALKALKGRAK